MILFITFILSWIAFLVFADKQRWRELLPVSFFASLCGTTTDLIMHYYKLWEFTEASTIIPVILDDFGIYVAFPYLFLQWLPSNRTFGHRFRYWFIWAAIAIFIEWIYIYTGQMKYYKWWNIGYSYLADWILLWIFYKYYKIFRFKNK